MYDHTQRLEQRALTERERFRQFVQILCTVDVISTDGPVERWRAGERNVGTEVVLAGGAVKTFVAGNTGLDGYAIADTQMRHVAACVDNNPGAFVAKDVV